MKTTYYVTGFLNDPEYVSGLRSFMQQYQDKFPGLQYLHLEIEQIADTEVENSQQQLLYSQDGRGLKIHLAKWNCKIRPTAFELYDDLRFVFDSAVEGHLKKHQNVFFVAGYL